MVVGCQDECKQQKRREQPLYRFKLCFPPYLLWRHAWGGHVWFGTISVTLDIGHIYIEYGRKKAHTAESTLAFYVLLMKNVPGKVSNSQPARIYYLWYTMNMDSTRISREYRKDIGFIRRIFYVNKRGRCAVVVRCMRCLGWSWWVSMIYQFLVINADV